MKKPGFLLTELMIAVAAVCAVVVFTVNIFNYLNHIRIRYKLDKLHVLPCMQIDVRQ